MIQLYSAAISAIQFNTNARAALANTMTPVVPCLGRRRMPHVGPRHQPPVSNSTGAAMIQPSSGAAVMMQNSTVRHSAVQFRYATNRTVTIIRTGADITISPSSAGGANGTNSDAVTGAIVIQTIRSRADQIMIQTINSACETQCSTGVPRQRARGTGTLGIAAAHDTRTINATKQTTVH